MKRIISTAVVSIALLSVIIYLLYKEVGLTPNDTKTLLVDTLKESVRLLLQLIVIVIAGNFMLTSYNGLRQKKQEAKEFRRTIHKLLVNAYLNTKKSRYVLKAKCKSNFIPYSAYEKEIHKIIDTKIQLEIIIHEIEKNKSNMKPNEDRDLVGELESMESYLRNLIEEYTKGNIPQLDSANNINVKDLVHLCHFVNSKQVDANLQKQPEPKKLTKAKVSHFSVFYREHFYGALDVLKTKREKELVEV